MHPSRRDVLRGLLAIPGALALTSGALSALPAVSTGGRKLVLFELDGGNDGLNTVVPHGLFGGLYASEYRPTTAIPAGACLPIDTGLGLHPALAPLMSHWDAGRLAIVQGVGSAGLTFSHEEARRAWATGDTGGLTPDGWLGRVLAAPTGTGMPAGVAIEGTRPTVVSGAGTDVPAFTKLSSFAVPYDNEHDDEFWLRRVAYEQLLTGATTSPDPRLASVGATGEQLLQLIDALADLPEFPHVGDYPEAWSPTQALQLAMRLMAGGLGLDHFTVRLGGFDTHANQVSGDDVLTGTHADLLGRLSQGLAAFHADLTAAGLADDVLILVYSEFGRALHENGSLGTDHGTAGPVLVLGNGVSGGLVGEHPSLLAEDLTDQDELTALIDFRDVLGTVADRWLGADPAAVFPGHGYAPLPFLAS